MRGVVAEFDEARGLGVVVTDTGEALGFHCVEIADGSRTIPVGAPVEASRAAGRLGRDEATAVALVA